MWTFSTYLGILTLCTAECLGMQMIFFYVCSSRLQFLIQKQTWRDKKFWTVMNSTEKETGNLQMIVSVEYYGLLNYGAKKVANLWSKSIISCLVPSTRSLHMSPIYFSPPLVSKQIQICKYKYKYKYDVTKTDHWPRFELPVPNPYTHSHFLHSQHCRKQRKVQISLRQQQFSVHCWSMLVWKKSCINVLFFMRNCTVIL